jgi:hypothetical protein
MKRSKFDDQNNGSRPRDANRRREFHNEDEEYPHPKSKKSGKRFHRRKTLRDELWDDLTNGD